MANITSATYNLTQVTNSTNVLEFVQGVNDLTGQFFMLGMLIALFVILLTSMKSPTVPTKDAFVVSSFVTAITSIFFAALDFISVPITILIVLIFGLVFVFVVLRDN